LPQPKKPVTRMTKVPRGSRCARGLSVVRPKDLGVGSPKKSAVKAWAASWMPIARMMPPKMTINAEGLEKMRFNISVQGLASSG